MEYIQDIIENIRYVVANHKISDGAYARWNWQNEENTRELGVNPYGCADAANILYSIGDFPRDPVERQCWIDTLRKMQDPETGLFHEKTHHPIHTTAHCAAALELFDALPAYPVYALHHTLPEGGLEDFLEHIEKCSSCYDELATYFIVHKAMQQLDEKQEDTVLDFKELLEEDIRKSRRYIRKKKFHKAIAAVAVCVLIAALVVFLVFVILELKEGI